MITITESAKAQIKSVLKKNSCAAVRLEVAGGGCAGFSYSFDLDESIADDDIRLDGGLIVDPMTAEVLGDSQVDFVNDLTGSYFKVNIPHAKSSCGCGTSFSI